MTRLNLPIGADTGFRFEGWDAFGNRFTANIYGAGRHGWFLARHKWFDSIRTVGPHELARGKWREFLGLVKQAGFWDLPESLPADPNIVTDDGEWITLLGRDGDRCHRVFRDGCGHKGIFQIQRFLTRLSGFFPEPRPKHITEGLALHVESPFQPQQNKPGISGGSECK